MNQRRQWIIRLCCLVLILGSLGLYQQKALGWEHAQAENQAAIAAINSQNAQLLAQQDAQRAADSSVPTQESILEPEDTGAYLDGAYSGTGTGFGGDITVTVTITGGKITEITVDDAAGEDSAYFSMAQQILDQMIAAQTADVDTISGATFSSSGLREATANALSQAEGN